MRTLVALAAIGVLSTCATMRATPIRLEESQSLIRSAESLGAASVPTAMHHLELARLEEEQARQLANVGDPRAALLVERAKADAEVAVALAQEAKVLGMSLEAHREVQALRGGR